MEVTRTLINNLVHGGNIGVPYASKELWKLLEDTAIIDRIPGLWARLLTILQEKGSCQKTQVDSALTQLMKEDGGQNTGIKRQVLALLVRHFKKQIEETLLQRV